MKNKKNPFTFWNRDAKNIILKERFDNLLFAYKFIWQADKKIYFFRIPLIILRSALNILPAFFTRAILNELTTNRNIPTIMFYTIGMVSSIFFIKLLIELFNMWDIRGRKHLEFNTTKLLTNSVMNMNYATLENPEMQDFVWLIQLNRFDMIFQLTTDILGALLTILGTSSIIISLNPWITFIIIIATIIRLCIERYEQSLPYLHDSQIKRASRKNTTLIGNMKSLFFGKEIRVNNLQDWLYNRAIDNWNNNVFPIDKKLQNHLSLCKGSSGIIGIIQDISIYLILAFAAIDSTITIGDFSMYFSLAGTFSSQILSVSSSYSNLITHTDWYIKQFRHCLSIAEKNIENTSTIKPETHVKVKIEFRNVSFKYPNTEQMVLKNLNIVIHPGESLSIVGKNGSGKTTFVKLLCRLYEPTEGEILINDISVKNYSISDYFKLLSVVFQDFNIFHYKIYENIVMNKDYDEQKLNQIIQQSNLKERVETLPNGVHTFITKLFDSEGIELSGGESQKIAIARVLYKNTPIIILDEPTSALDPIAEYNIYHNFHEIAKNRTALFVSHRLSTTRFTDHTAVFDNGTIIEYGTHEELMSIEKGTYQAMFNTQAKYYK